MQRYLSACLLFLLTLWGSGSVVADQQEFSSRSIIDRVREASTNGDAPLEAGEIQRGLSVAQSGRTDDRANGSVLDAILRLTPIRQNVERSDQRLWGNDPSGFGFASYFRDRHRPPSAGQPEAVCDRGLADDWTLLRLGVRLQI